MEAYTACIGPRGNILFLLFKVVYFTPLYFVTTEELNGYWIFPLNVRQNSTTESTFEIDITSERIHTQLVKQVTLHCTAATSVIVICVYFSHCSHSSLLVTEI